MGDCIWLVGEGFLGELGGAGSVGGVWCLGDRLDWSRVIEGMVCVCAAGGRPHWERTEERQGQLTKGCATSESELDPESCAKP